MNIWNENLTPDQVARKLAHTVLVENTDQVMSKVSKEEKAGLITMQEALDVMQAWNHLLDAFKR